MLGNKRIMGNNIQMYMNKMGIERRELAKAIGVPYSSLTDWINGNTYPRIDKIEKMARYFGIEKADLVEEGSKRKEVTSTRIPVLGRVAAGIPIDAIENIIDWEEIPTEMSRHGEYYGLVIRGDSMEPRIYNGDVVIVKKQDTAESGSIVIATVNGDDATCKRYMKYEHSIALVSLNPKHPPMVFSEDDVDKMPIAIWGIVVEIRGKMEGL